MLMPSTAKGASAKLQASMIQELIDAWNDMPLDVADSKTCRGALSPPQRVTSDGDGPTRQCFNSLLSCEEVHADSELSLTLQPKKMPLFDKTVGPRPDYMTEWFDDKHCGKRWRERQKSEGSGVEIGDQALAKPVTRHLFKKSGLDHWITYSNSEDPQNVRLTLLLQRGLRELDEIDANSLPNLKATDTPLESMNG